MRQADRPIGDHEAVEAFDEAGQLSSVPGASVTLLFFARRQPPDATGPNDFGLYVARLEAAPTVSGEGRTEDAALRALGPRLRDLADYGPARSALTPVAQALRAAELLPEDELVDFLKRWAKAPVLGDEEPRAVSPQESGKAR